MKHFAVIETDTGPLSLGMRVGLHTGRFMAADIGTPRRMEHILLGSAVQTAKRSEGAGEKGRVNLTEAALERVKNDFRFEPGKPGHWLVVDDLSDDQLGEYDIATSSRRPPSMVLMDRSVEGLTAAIENAVNLVEPLACYLPDPVLNLVVESAARRRIVPDFPRPTVMFVNLIGLPESIDSAQPDEAEAVIASFSRVFAMINAAVETRGGVLKKVTYHTAGSDIVIYFGAPTAHTNDNARAAAAALAIRDIITSLVPPTVGGKQVTVECQIGLNQGNTFAAEIGEPRGRREFNVLGDTVNTAARLMSRAVGNRILLSDVVYQDIVSRFKCDSLGKFPLKGKAQPLPMYALKSALS
jgi:class 3 adenylate cyclase